MFSLLKSMRSLELNPSPLLRVMANFCKSIWQIIGATPLRLIARLLIRSAVAKHVVK